MPDAKAPRRANVGGQPIAEGRLIAGAEAAQALQPLEAELRDARFLAGTAHGDTSPAQTSGASLLKAVYCSSCLQKHMIAHEVFWGHPSLKGGKHFSTADCC